MNSQNKYNVKNTEIQFLIVLLFFVLFLFSARAQKVYSVEDVPNVHLSDARQYVSDPEHKIAPKYTATLNDQLRFLEDSLAIQCATIVLPKIDEEPSTFAHDLLNQWGVGDKKTDRGLVILLVYGNGEGSKREIYMATGYGLEGDLPDAICKEIQVDTMLPLLKEEKFGEGLVAGVFAIHKALTDEKMKIRIAQIVEKKRLLDEESERESIILISIWAVIGTLIMSYFIYTKIKRFSNVKKNPYQTVIDFQNKERGNHFGELGCWLVLMFLPWVFILEVFTYYIKRSFIKKHLKCEACGSLNMKFKRSSRKVIVKATPSKRGIIRYTFVCKKCNHKHLEDSKISYMSSSSGSSGGGSSYSGGSSGGSWGGGSSGGGGAGSSF